MSGAVIKAGTPWQAMGGSFNLDLRDLARDAETITASARGEAERILSDARHSAAALRELEHQAGHRSGYQEGLAKGEEAGRQAAMAEARERFAKDQSSLLSTLTQLVAELTERRERLHVAARRDVVVLAVAIASRLAKRLCEHPPIANEAAEDACRNALELIGHATEIVIRVHPDDAASIERLCHELTATMKSGRHVRVADDPEVGRGGVVVETERGGVDAGVRTQVDRIADELVGDWRTRLKELAIDS